MCTFVVSFIGSFVGSFVSLALVGYFVDKTDKITADDHEEAAAAALTRGNELRRAVPSRTRCAACEDPDPADGDYHPVQIDGTKSVFVPRGTTPEALDVSAAVLHRIAAERRRRRVKGGE